MSDMKMDMDPQRGEDHWIENIPPPANNIQLPEQQHAVQEPEQFCELEDQQSNNKTVTSSIFDMVPSPTNFVHRYRSSGSSISFDDQDDHGSDTSSRNGNGGCELDVVDVPGEYDVLCGQDKTFGKHPGNRIYRAVITSFVDAYCCAANKQCKMQMTQHIVTLMRTKYHTQFLKPHYGATTTTNRNNSSESLRQQQQQQRRDSSCSGYSCNSNNSSCSNNKKDFGVAQWKVISVAAARDKVSHALRTAALAETKKQRQSKKKKASSTKAVKTAKRTTTRQKRVGTKSDDIEQHQYVRTLTSTTTASDGVTNQTEQPSSESSVTTTTTTDPQYSHCKNEVARALLQRQQLIFSQLKARHGYDSSEPRVHSV